MITVMAAARILSWKRTENEDVAGRGRDLHGAAGGLVSPQHAIPVSVCLEVQHLEALKGRFADPLLNRTFGASLRGGDMVRDGARALKSSRPAKRHELSLCVLAGRAERRTPG